MLLSALSVFFVIPLNLFFSFSPQGFYPQIFPNIEHPSVARSVIKPVLTPPSVPLVVKSNAITIPILKPSSAPVPSEITQPIESISTLSSSVHTPVPTPTPSPAQAPQTPPPSSTSSGSFIDQINDYRRSQGLSAVRSDPYTCSFAQIRAQEIVNNFNHDGFNSRISSKTLPYPSYSKVTENLAMNVNPGDIVSRWINSPGHAANLRADTPYVCVQNSGNYYAFEGWKS